MTKCELHPRQYFCLVQLRRLRRKVAGAGADADAAETPYLRRTVERALPVKAARAA